MADQAEALRNLMDSQKPRTNSRIIAVGSGKGGVGKSNFTVNFALALRKLGRTPIIIDLDIGFANIELLLGAKSHRKLGDILLGKTIWEVITESPAGIPFITAGSSFTDFGRYTEPQITQMVESLKQLHERYDTILLDGSAGLGSNMGHLISIADDMILVITPEPTAMSDAYSLVKFLHRENELPPTHIVTNRARSLVDARNAASNVQLASSRFLGISLMTLGFILDDQHVSDAVRNQTAFFSAYPNSMASKCVMQLAKNYLNVDEKAELPTRKTGFGALIGKLFNK